MTQRGAILLVGRWRWPSRCAGEPEAAQTPAGRRGAGRTALAGELRRALDQTAATSPRTTFPVTPHTPDPSFTRERAM